MMSEFIISKMAMVAALLLFIFVTFPLAYSLYKERGVIAIAAAMAHAKFALCFAALLRIAMVFIDNASTGYLVLAWLYIPTLIIVAWSFVSIAVHTRHISSVYEYVSWALQQFAGIVYDILKVGKLGK